MGLIGFETFCEICDKELLALLVITLAVGRGGPQRCTLGTYYGHRQKFCELGAKNLRFCTETRSLGTNHPGIISTSGML
jgi:hypothetical protein